MEIIDNNKNISGVCIILGFFDGIHLGHQRVILNAVEYAKYNNTYSLLLTFKNSPAEYFNNYYQYIYTREQSYKFIKDMGVNYILEEDFSELANISAINYLQKFLVKKYCPISITSGFNYTFGYKKEGTTEMLEKYQNKYNYRYFGIPAIKQNGQIVSSSLIKQKLSDGNIQAATTLLGKPFSLVSKVIQGQKLGRTIGFPTANLLYPKKIVKIPHGVYIVEVLNRKAVLNWGIKPTISGEKELLEVHIPNYVADLYDKFLEIKFIKKLRDEKKFANLEELKLQIEKDLECLK